MDVNGTRLHLVLGLDDWAELGRAADRPRRVLRPSVAARSGFGRDRSCSRPVPAAARLVPADRRGAAVDRFGNHFWISPDRHSLAGARGRPHQAFLWWPPPSTPGPRPTGRSRRARSRLPDDLGSAAWRSPRTTTWWLGVLDLPGNGRRRPVCWCSTWPEAGHRSTWWPSALGVRPFDLTALPGGGVACSTSPTGRAPGPPGCGISTAICGC